MSDGLCSALTNRCFSASPALLLVLFHQPQVGMKEQLLPGFGWNGFIFGIVSGPSSGQGRAAQPPKKIFLLENTGKTKIPIPEGFQAALRVRLGQNPIFQAPLPHCAASPLGTAVL